MSEQGPPPKIALLEQYTPRVCAGPDCPLPPHVRWIVTSEGVLFGRYRRMGEHIHLCQVHEDEAAMTAEADWDDEPTPSRGRNREGE